MEEILAASRQGCLVGRVWRPDAGGPAVVAVRDNDVFDITSRDFPTMRDLLETDDPRAVAGRLQGERLTSLADLLARSNEAASDTLHLLAPCDLQAVKACGVTFARSLVERVIEERAGGKAEIAHEIREQITSIVGSRLRDLEPGSAEAARVKSILVDAGYWSQYLEVGIGPDAEVFTKAQVLSSVGWGAAVGLHPISNWNNPEPEIVLAVDSGGRVKGATLGNDVNLRDVEGRSALLLGKAKDNNASCSIGPFIRLFDESYGIDDVRAAELSLTIEGTDGFKLTGRSSMREISRDPLDLVAQTIGRHHQYPDGLVLFMGTLFAPVEDRDVAGQGFTHKQGDIVVISDPMLGNLRNTVRLSTECPPWTFGAASLMRNLTKRGLL